MPFRIEPIHLPGALVIENDAFRDERGFFREVFRADRFRELGLPAEFVQDNHSGSKRGVVRGLHFQWEPPMGKLMRVTVGAAFLVAVDIRKGSPTLGKWVGIEASAENGKQLWAPAGFARGFCALTDCEVQYKCTGVYNAQGESGIRWNDPAIGIAWPVANPSLSAKDAAAQTLAEWLARPESDRFRFDPAHPNR
ncbi:MAG TPA: dTDP-4-dehydrorhamnose 3,5-epimerase [Terriglobales bacterium]|nr:dTDP-4-dehydrorhamnose 3,5-epimerase [Terriglobales bacterium]